MTKESFLYEKVYSDLKEKINGGILQEGDKLEAEADMVKRYQVSTITIKKALTLLAQEHLIERVRGKGSFVTGVKGNKADEKEEQDKLMQEEELKKEKNLVPAEKVIGVIFEHISSSYGLQMLYEMDHQVRKKGYRLYPCFSYGNQEQEMQWISYLRNLGVQGICIMPVHGSHYNTEILKMVIDRFPAVLIDKKMEGIPLDSVRTDGENAILRLVCHMAERGKKKIAMVTVDEGGTSSITERQAGFLKGMKMSGLKPQKPCLLPYVDYEDSFQVYGEIYRGQIRNYIEQYKNDLDGLVCLEYGLAMETVKVLEEKGMEQQVQVCCIDENYLGPDQYRMTHVKQDEKKLADCAVELLFEKIRTGKKEWGDYLIPGMFVEMKE